MSQSMSQPVPQPLPHHIHLVGAGGIMMSGIGEILLARGHTVTGSDLESSRYTERLREHGPLRAVRGGGVVEKVACADGAGPA